MNRRKFMVGAGSVGLAAITGGAFLGAAEEAGVDPVEALTRSPNDFVEIEHEITNPADSERFISVRFAVYNEDDELLNDRFTGRTFGPNESVTVSLVVLADYDEAEYYEAEVDEVE